MLEADPIPAHYVAVTRYTRRYGGGWKWSVGIYKHFYSTQPSKSYGTLEEAKRRAWPALLRWIEGERDWALQCLRFGEDYRAYADDSEDGGDAA